MRIFAEPKFYLKKRGHKWQKYTCKAMGKTFTVIFDSSNGYSEIKTKESNQIPGGLRELVKRMFQNFYNKSVSDYKK